MRVLVLGAAGMLGHKILQRLQADYEVAGTIREPSPDAVLNRALSGIELYPGVQANDLPTLERAISSFDARG